MSFLDVAEIADAVRHTREAAGNQLRVAVGGRAFDLQPALVEQFAADVYGRTAPESVARAKQMLGLPTS
jgi:hypothetical protein